MCKQGQEVSRSQLKAVSKCSHHTYDKAFHEEEEIYAVSFKDRFQPWAPSTSQLCQKEASPISPFYGLNMTDCIQILIADLHILPWSMF